jgi:hypothetical protein
VVAINVGRTSTDRRLVDAMTRTLMEIFPDVHAIDVPRSFNTILVGTMQPSSTENLAENLRLLPDDDAPILREVLNITAAALVPSSPSKLLFTDDRAPVETLVDSLVLNFLLFGDVEEIR